MKTLEEYEQFLEENPNSELTFKEYYEEEYDDSWDQLDDYDDDDPEIDEFSHGEDEDENDVEAFEVE